MEQLPLHEGLTRYRSAFGGRHLDLTVASILAGNTEGELWATSGRDASRCLLLWDGGNNVLYVDGNAADIAVLTHTIETEIRPRSLARGRARFKVRALSPAIEERLTDLFPGIELQASPTLFFIDDVSRALPDAPDGVPGMAIVPIDRSVLAPGALRESDEVREEIGSMWPSLERFYDRAFGIVAVVDGEIICWCTAEYLSAATCGIGIATSPRHQERGVATAVALRFLKEARARGMTACWECAAWNTPSVRVAEKIGLVRESEEMYWVGSFGR